MSGITAGAPDRDDFFRLDGKVAFVGGAGSVGPGWGNGKATAVLLARRGAKVFCTDISASAVEETVEIILSEGGTAQGFVMDATDSKSVQDAVATCVQVFGGIDITVNNVGGSVPGGAAEMEEEVWDRQVALNLNSAYLGCKYTIPHILQRGGGAIVNLSSIVAIRMAEGRVHAAYTATKSAVIALSRSIAIQHAARGLRCNTVIPGLLHTPLVEARLVGQLGAADAAALLAKRNRQIPMKQAGTGWDVANAVLYLVSKEAGHVTGTELIVDGGLAAAMPGG